jgi:basic membrane lipoprotein Med (substrate-binding protein (PBP1-ABC) superfamily)
MVKRVDRLVSAFLIDAAAGRFTAGVHREGLADQSVGYSVEGAPVQPIIPRLDQDTKKIINGTIVVPSGV